MRPHYRGSSVNHGRGEVHATGPFIVQRSKVRCWPCVYVGLLRNVAIDVTKQIPQVLQCYTIRAFVKLCDNNVAGGDI
jgi:hypothetical protein